MNPSDSTHIYDRQLEGEDVGSILTTVASFLKRDSQVLDVGTGSGALGRHASTQLSCQVDGITYSQAEADLASRWYRNVQLADLEQVPPSTLFPNERYDAIVCADVLEHLRNCETVLSDLRSLLKPGGQVVVSLPNVAYSGVLAGLLCGNFQYTREGLLDATHVRFFTLAAIEELTQAAGFQIESLVRIPLSATQTEFRKLSWDLLAPSLRTAIEAHPEAEVYEYVLNLVPASNSVRRLEDKLPGYAENILQAGFEVQVFLDTGTGFDERRSMRKLAYLPQPQSLEFSLPACETLRQLRIDLVDRPGMFELFLIECLHPNETRFWNWHTGWTSEFQASDLELLPAIGPKGGRVLRSTSFDSFLTIAFDPPVSLPAGGKLKIKLTGPQEYDGIALHWAEDKVRTQLEEISTTSARLSELLMAAEQARTGLQHQVKELIQVQSGLVASLQLAQSLQATSDALVRSSEHIVRLQQDVAELPQLKQVNEELRIERDNALRALNKLESSLARRIVAVLGWCMTKISHK
jgi:2-polyprenyl-3-methyl-5-hydroxy-6-metoxy-1,4-benzoquinol methylase